MRTTMTKHINEETVEEILGKATPEVLWQIHRELTELLLRYLKETPADKLRAQMLSVIRSFLADNQITYADSKAGLVVGLHEITEKYPFDNE